MSNALTQMLDSCRDAVASLFTSGRKTNQRADTLPRWLGGRITIARLPADVYGFWRSPSNLVMVFRILQTVEVHSGGGSHWVVRGRSGESLVLDCEPVIEEVGERIAWRAVDAAPVHSELAVTFSAIGETSTELVVAWTISLRRPGSDGAPLNLDGFVDETAQRMLDDDLQRLKTSLEIEGKRLQAEAQAEVERARLTEEQADENQCEECSAPDH